MEAGEAAPIVEPRAVGAQTRRPPRSAGAWRRLWVDLAVWLACSLPLAKLLYDLPTGGLGANPIEAITDRTGWWGLALLLATLAVTPLRRWSGWHAIARQRRTLGLATFGYVSLHMLTYFVLDLGLDFSHIAEDIVQRPFMTVGAAAWLLLLPLAVTSTRGWMRRLGPRWAKLHRLVYLVVPLALLHFFWSQKADRLEPLVFAGAFTAVLGARWLWRWRRSPAPSDADRGRRDRAG